MQLGISFLFYFGIALSMLEFVPEKAGRDNTHLYRGTEAAAKWKIHRNNTALCFSKAEANRKYLEHVGN